MPISYDSSDLLKCNVSMTYIRYLVNTTFPPLSDSATARVSSIIDQASTNTTSILGDIIPDRVGSAFPLGANDLSGTLSNVG